MAVRRHAIFDGAEKSQYVDVSLGGRGIETTLSLQVATNQYCHSTLAVDPVGVAGFEVLHYGSSLDPETVCIFGIAFGLSTFAPGYGGDNTLGVNMVTGDVCHDAGDVVESLPQAGANVVYGMVVDFDRETISIYRDKKFSVAFDFPAGLSTLTALGTPCYISCSIGDGPAGRATLWLNSGQQAFETPQLAGLGWFETLEAPFDIRVAEREYLSPPTADEPNTRFRGSITSAGSLSVRNLTFWPWGQRTTGSSALRLTLANGDGAYDATIGGDFRDEPSELSIVNDDGSVQFLGSFVFDKAEAQDDSSVQLLFRDAVAELEKPGQNKFFLPNAEGSVANRAYPSTIGAAFSVPLVAYDLLNRLYAIDSLGTARVGKVRDKGDPLELGASPQDYEIVDGGRAVQLRFDPEGVVTADIGVTSTDLTALNGSPPLDVILGDGNPFDPAAWSAGSFLDSGVASIVSGEATFELSGAGGYHWLEYAAVSNVLQQGKSYIIRLQVMRLPNGSDRATSFVVSPNASPFGAILTARGQPEPEYNAPARTWERVYETFYTPTATHGLFLIYLPSSVTGAEKCRIANLTVVEIPVINPADEDSEVDEEITPVPLHGAMKQMIEDRWELPSTFWEESDALAIDAVSGYAGIGWHASEQYVRRQALEDVLTGYTAASYIDQNNKLRVVRMIAPEDVPDSGIAGEVRFGPDMLQDLVPAYDDAPGLTTRLGVRKNYRTLNDSDLVTDFVEVPLSLRRRLAQDYRFILASGVPLAPGYSHADLGSAIGTALARKEDGQTEIDRIARIYTKARAFWTTTTPYTPGDLELGQVYRVFYPRYGMDSGVKLMFVGETLDPISRLRQSAVFWGLAPSELLKEQS